VNGRLLEFDPMRIAAVLAEFVEERWTPQPGVHLKEALDAEAYAHRLAEELESVAAPHQHLPAAAASLATS
jgi:hypothetical protein